MRNPSVTPPDKRDFCLAPLRVRGHYPLEILSHTKRDFQGVNNHYFKEKIMKKIITIFAFCSLLLTGGAMAMDMSKDKGKTMDHSTMNQASAPAMDHSAMDHSASMEGGTFKQAVMVDGIHAEFQVMDLASMKMTDPDGRTHHIMVTFMKNNEKIATAVGKIKLISPSGKEQIGALKDFGSGVFAANFSFDEAGKWGVICLFKDDVGQHTAKFWYPHKMM